MARSSDSIFPISLFRDRTFQASEVRRAMGVAMLYLAVTTALLGVVYSQLLDRLLAGAAPLLFVSEDAALVNEAVPAMSSMLGQWMAMMLLVNVVITTALGLYLSRRLGAPLLALKRALREFGAGNLDVQLRESDSREFAEITEELTTAVAAIREQIGAAKQVLDAPDPVVEAKEAVKDEATEKAGDEAKDDATDGAADDAKEEAGNEAKDETRDETSDEAATDHEAAAEMAAAAHAAEIARIEARLKKCKVALDYFQVDPSANDASADADKKAA